MTQNNETQNNEISDRIASDLKHMRPMAPPAAPK